MNMEALERLELEGHPDLVYLLEGKGNGGGNGSTDFMMFDLTAGLTGIVHLAHFFIYLSVLFVKKNQLHSLTRGKILFSFVPTSPSTWFLVGLFELTQCPSRASTLPCVLLQELHT